MITRFTLSWKMKEVMGVALVIAILAYMSYLMFEPTLGMAQTSVQDQFTVTQVVTGEIAFLTTATDVTMSPSLPGITGGTSNGGTQVVVFTNDEAGYSMTLKASSSAAMQGNTQGGEIPDYTPAVGTVPDYSFTVGANTAEFGYTVEASTTTDLDQSFLDNGSNTCNTGSTDGTDTCWLNASTTNETVVNRSSETVDSGSTTTLKFRITINSNPSPSIPADTYVATTTLTATTNP